MKIGEPEKFHLAALGDGLLNRDFSHCAAIAVLIRMPQKDKRPAAHGLASPFGIPPAAIADPPC
jgi:hypothetical protein